MRYLPHFVFLIGILLMVCIISCNSAKDQNGNKAIEGINVLVVNDCQYIVYKTSNSFQAGCAIVHAGNCSNPYHTIK